MIIVKGGVTAPNGFLANGVKAGIKESVRRDLALLYSEMPAQAAAAFTTNRFQASPIKVSKAYIKNKTHQAILVNSGNANCANGKAGDSDAAASAYYIAKVLGLDREEVLVASTGIIGRKLPLDKIEDAIPDLVSDLSKENGKYFAESILTTDTVKKEFVVKTRLGPSTVTIGGACKGVGMICPYMKVENHATMLAFITTDAAISKKMLESALGEAVRESFNMVSVDGDMSTNDSAFLLANGLAANKRIYRKDDNYRKFTDALVFLTCELAKMLARDGEGATKFVEIDVVGARRENDARAVARKVSTSNLLKCCIYGEDPNWGRIVAACGASGAYFKPDRLDVYLGSMKVVSGGVRAKDYDKKKAGRIFKEDDINIKVDLKAGRYSAKSWTCDFSKEYVGINSEYST